jgi:hypothetical protein
MATLSTQTIVRGGLNPTYASCAGGGDVFTPGAQTFLHVKNGGGSNQTVTVAAAGGQPLSDLTFTNPSCTVVAGGAEFMGPFPASVFAGSGGTASITYSGVTSLTVAVLNMEQP